MTEGTQHDDPAVDEAAADEIGVTAAEQVADHEPAVDETAGASEAPEDDADAAEQVAPDEAVAEQVAPDEAVAEQVAEGAGDEAEQVAEGAEDEGEAGDSTAETTETDDVADAIAAAGENIEAEASLDDIAPGTVIAPDEAAEAPENTRPNSVSIWPFVGYVLVWAAFAGALVWQMHDLPRGVAVWQAVDYPYYVIGGVVLTIAGPLMILSVWIASWGKPGSTKGGLFISALIKGSIATLLGVLMWWAALLALDQIRFGSLL